MTNNELLMSFLDDLEQTKRYNNLDSKLLSDIFKYYLINHNNNNLNIVSNILINIDVDKQILLKNIATNEQLESLILLVEKKDGIFKPQNLLKEYLKRDVENKDNFLLSLFDNNRNHCDTLLVSLIENDLISKEFIVDNNFDNDGFKSYYKYRMREEFEINNEQSFELH